MPDARDELGYVIAAYQSCDRLQYEGASGLYCRHLEKVHSCPPELLADVYRHAVHEWAWLAADRLHQTYLNLPGARRGD